MSEENTEVVSGVDSTPVIGTVDVSRDIKAIEAAHKEIAGDIYLMGTSFILGVVFTVFVLLILDFMRRNNEENEG